MDYFIVTLQQTKSIYTTLYHEIFPIHAPIYIMFWEEYFSCANLNGLFHSYFTKNQKTYIQVYFIICSSTCTNLHNFWIQYFSTAIPPSIAMNNKAENNITYMTSLAIQGSLFDFV